MAWHFFCEGLLLGWGACIPLGPMNIEIIRRHLVYGLRFGVAFGLGASLSDLTYFLIVYAGSMQMMTDHVVHQWLGYISILALLYFAVSALRTKTQIPDSVSVPTGSRQSVLRHGLVGYCFTLVNPYTVIFWVAVGIQLATLRSASVVALLFLGLGVVLSTVSWVAGLNYVLLRIKRHVTPAWMQRCNYIGAACLFGFVFLVAYDLFVKRLF
jgi:L-lysine exporter family protein LysE/ArgO